MFWSLSIQNQLKGKNVNCFVCNAQVYKSPKELRNSKSGNYFCSRSCQTKWKNKVFSGEKSSNWLTGEGTYRNILLRTGDLPVCLLCRISDIRVLCVHHRDHNRANNNLINLVWLCMNCHYLLHHNSEIDQKMRK